MPGPSWENLDTFLQGDAVGGFAVTATIALQDGRTLPPIKGIFDDPYLNAELGEFDHDTSDPRFLCKMADVKDVRRGDTVTIDDVDYDVKSTPQDDGTGMATIKLAPVAA